MQYQLYDLSPRPFSTIINNVHSFSTILNHIQPDGWGDGTGTCWLAPLTWATGPPGSGTCSLSIQIYSSGKPSACNALPPSRSNLQASLVLLMICRHPDLLFRQACTPIYRVPALPSSRSTHQASLVLLMLSRHPDPLFRQSRCY